MAEPNGKPEARDTGQPPGSQSRVKKMESGYAGPTGDWPAPDSRTPNPETHQMNRPVAVQSRPDSVHKKVSKGEGKMKMGAS